MSRQSRHGILVAGAGPAGLAAAIAAARAGARTLLVEAESRTGGLARSGLHPYLCGLYPQADAGTRLLNPGLSTELCAALDNLAPETAIPVTMGKAQVRRLPDGALAAILEKLAAAEPLLEIRTDCRLIELDCAGSLIVEARLAIPNGYQKILPSAVIDCTGDAIACRLANSSRPAASRGKRQLAGFSIRVTGLGTAGSLPLQIQVPLAIAQAMRGDRSLPATLRFTTFAPGTLPGEGYCKLALLPDGAVAADALASQVLEILRKTIPAFRQASIAATSPKPLLRDNARLAGKATLTIRDIVSGRKFADAAAHGAWPAEFWDQTSGPRYQYPPPGTHYDIPSDCLRSARIGNLFAAGRCLSASPLAAAAIRVMGTCIATGEAAGRLAAQADKNRGS